jgi:hypothetical protein
MSVASAVAEVRPSDCARRCRAAAARSRRRTWEAAARAVRAWARSYASTPKVGGDLDMLARQFDARALAVTEADA